MTFESEKQIWERLKHVSDPLERRLRFVAWLTRALGLHGVRPVVVGGHALEFYTLGMRPVILISCVWTWNRSAKWRKIAVGPSACWRFTARRWIGRTSESGPGRRAHGSGLRPCGRACNDVNASRW